jgi:hypothetical protein
MTHKLTLFILLIISFTTKSYAQVTLNLKLFIEGYTWNGAMDNFGAGGCLYILGYSPNFTDVDTIIVSLMDDTLLTEVTREKGILQTNGTVTINFGSSVIPMESYYIRILHRSAIETWSAAPVEMTSITTYDFSSSNSQAYENNMIDVGTVSQPLWALFSGDISAPGLGVGYQDGVITGQDYSDMEDAVFLVLTGYVCQDITGDGMVLGDDYSIMENNVYFVIHLHRPFNISIDEVQKIEKSQSFKFFTDGTHEKRKIYFTKTIISDPLIFIYSLDGRELKCIRIRQQTIQDNQFELDISELIAGMYIIRLFQI